MNTIDFETLVVTSDVLNILQDDLKFFQLFCISGVEETKNFLEKRGTYTFFLCQFQP